MIYDNIVMRTIVDLPLDQVNALRKFCEALGISRAEEVRRAVNQFREFVCPIPSDRAAAGMLNE